METTTAQTAGRITRLLPAMPSNRARVLNAQRRVREVAAMRFPSSLDVARRRNAQRILDLWNNEGRI